MKKIKGKGKGLTEHGQTRGKNREDEGAVWHHDKLANIEPAIMSCIMLLTFHQINLREV